VSGVKVTFEQRLVLEQETTTALKGEHAVMKKKYQVLQKEAKDLEEGIKGRGMLEKQLRDVVKGLEKDIVGHRKEVLAFGICYSLATNMDVLGARGGCPERFKLSTFFEPVFPV
jgi:hypothetical protein